MVDCRSSRLSLFHLLLVVSLSSLSSSIHVTSSSPCRSVCTASSLRTTADDFVCFDNDFAATTNGTRFQDCVECELGSTAVDPSNGATDVTWGLYNLRYALSTCVFGFPVQKASISTPCQVTCDPLGAAIRHNLETNATIEDLSYCNIPSFQNTVGINRCAECYGRMNGQAYMANFLQVLHIACLQPPRPSQPFPVAANTIFNSTPIATPTPSSTAVPSPSKPANLALMISLPVVFGVLILGSIVACCFYSARHRRRIMAERNGMRRIQDKHSPTFPPHHQHYQHNEMQAQSPQGFESVPVPEPVYYSPISDQKENPYVQPQGPASPLPPFQQLQFPMYKSYSPADYAHQNPSPARPSIDTSQIGPGPNQQKVSNLHDQYFPLPPPPPAPPQLAMQPPPPPPSIPQEGVESLRQHHMKTPSLAMPMPRAKKSLDIQGRTQEQQRQRIGVGGIGESGDRDAIPLQDYGRPSGNEEWTTADDGVESPQVFVYDAVNDRYVKESPRERTPTG
ncbi:hypothetical protein GJ744_004555 [Endocarpon pusillum]|uniref:WSC domain-containing protein n=1 Tax=Endocarpon pusillum TaxID=364733 RepID=A0A8H7ARN3_9EURO|nr:hypothetical protein GJ744_004555 [Endocarpon pusillum]